MILRDLSRNVRAGKVSELPWELFRVANYPGRDHEDAVTELSAWAHEHGIAFEFAQRQVNHLPVIYVIFTAA